MTPGINAAKHANIAFEVHEYPHDPSAVSFGLEAAQKLGVSPARVFKTLVVDLGGRLAVAVLPVEASLSMKHIARALGAKKAEMAQPQLVERSTGYVLGGVSPLGQKKRLATCIDSSAQLHSSIYISAGKRGLEIELAPDDLAQLTSAQFHALQA